MGTTTLRFVAAVCAAGLLAGCSRGDDAGSGAASTSEAPAVEEPAAATPGFWDDPWSAPSVTGADFTRSRELLRAPDCPARPVEGTGALGDIVVIRAVQGCARFEVVAAQADVDAQLEKLRSEADVLAADVHTPVAPMNVAAGRGGSGGRGDPKAKDQWHLGMLDADSLPRLPTLANVPVAVLDTGMDTRHEDLRGTVYSDSGVAFDLRDGFGNRLDLYDEQYERCDGELDSGHGTHVAGLIGATRDNGVAGRGLAAGVPLLPLDVNVIDDAGNVNVFGLSEAIYLAVDAGVRVINMSIAKVDSRCKVDQKPNQLDEWAVRYALSHGVVLVASAGNCGTAGKSCPDRPDPATRSIVEYPAAFEGVISVAAVGPDGERSSFSTKNPFVDIAAPGGDLDDEGFVGPECVHSTMASARVEPDPAKRHEGRPRGDELDLMCGTSMAAPLVSATAALVIARNPALGPAEVAEVLTSSATAKGPKGRWSDEYGAGIVNPVAAVRLAGTAKYASPTTTAPRGPSPVTADELVTLDATELCHRFEGKFARESKVTFEGRVGLWVGGEFDSSHSRAVAVGDLDGDGVDDGAVALTCEFAGATSYVPELVVVFGARTRHPLRAEVAGKVQGISVNAERRWLVVRASEQGEGDLSCCPTVDVERRFAYDGARLHRTWSREYGFHAATIDMAEKVNGGDVTGAAERAEAGVVEALSGFQQRYGKLRSPEGTCGRSPGEPVAWCELRAANAPPGWHALVELRRNGWGDYTVTSVEEFTGDGSAG